MAKFKRIRKFGRTFLNVPTWMGWSRIKSGGQTIGTTARRLFIPQKASYQEEFSEAVTRLNLSETDIAAKKTAFLRLCLIFVVLGFLLLSYAIFLAWLAYVRAALVALGVTLMVFAIAFRYHFWYFQVREQRLGCTLRDWYYYNIAHSPPPSNPPTTPSEEPTTTHE